MRGGHRFVHFVPFPSSNLCVTGSLFHSGTPHCYLLPLGRGYNVHVCLLSRYSFLTSDKASRYCFAILLAGCRSILRPGAIWFIKDPQDQNSHPIRDILDRPTST